MLIPISNQVISDDREEPTVNARDLHAFLEVKSRFNDWIRNRIAEYDFTQGIDFTVIQNLVASETKTYGQGKIDYFITLELNCQRIDIIFNHVNVCPHKHIIFKEILYTL